MNIGRAGGVAAPVRTDAPFHPLYRSEVRSQMADRNSSLLYHARKMDTAAGRSLVGMIGVIGALHCVGWMVLLLVVVPQHLSVGGKVFDISIGMAAYLLGMRHAFDADHIAAIDNTTRRLTQNAGGVVSVGFWFSLGHSSVVSALSLLLAFGARDLFGPLLDDRSWLHAAVGLTGTIVSSGFLYVVAALNLVVFAEIWRNFRQFRAGRGDGASIDDRLEARGVLSRLTRPVMRLVTKPYQMYLVGLLFGLGFDTATEIALLVLAGSGAASGLPWYAILCLPVLFAAGMTLLDTIDGVFMSVAYRWAFEEPARKIYYNLVVTGLSVLVAVVVGTLEIAALLGGTYGFGGAALAWIGRIDLSDVGAVVVCLFVTIWAFAISGRRSERVGTIAGKALNRKR
jgi:nickel/cobalt transporter (NiCoT) family protein